MIIDDDFDGPQQPICLPCHYRMTKVDPVKFPMHFLLVEWAYSIGIQESMEYFWGTFGVLNGVLLGHFWSTFGALSGNFWSTFGVLLEHFWSTFGVLLEYFWSTFGVLFGQFWSTFGILLGTFGVLYVFMA